MAFQHSGPTKCSYRRTASPAPRFLDCQSAADRVKRTLRVWTLPAPVCASQLAQESQPNAFLPAAVELGARRGEVEHIDHPLALRVDERHFDVASQLGQRRADAVEQTGAVLSDEFEERARGRGSVVEANLRWNRNLGARKLLGARASAQEDRKSVV